MRKIFFLCVFLLIIVAGLIIRFEDETKDQISILSIHKNYSRLIASDTEHISLTIYLSSDNSFITNLDSITSCFIKNDKNQLEVVIKNINNLHYEEEFDGLMYYAYNLVIEFNNSMQTDTFIDIKNAYLSVNYLNGDFIDIEIGNLYLRFSPVVNEMHLDMSRMYAVMKQLDNYEYISGIVIGLNNLSLQKLDIQNISIGIPEVQLDLYNTIMVDIAPEYNQDIDNILGYHYEPIVSEIQETTISLDANHLIFIPIAYRDNLIEINRFPLIISYKYFEEEYQYIIDDFQFYSDILTLEANYGQIREYIYYY